MRLSKGNRSRRPIQRAFAITTQRTLAWAALGIVIIAGILSHRLFERRGAAVAIQQAEVCASALSPGPNGDLTDAVERLRRRYDRLLAVAPLSPAGAVQTIYTDDPAYYDAIRNAAVGTSHPVLVRARVGDAPVDVWAVTVPLNGSQTSGAWQAVFLLRHDSHFRAWAFAIAVFTLLVGSVCYMCYLALSRWMDQRVTSPLSRLRDLAQRPRSSDDRKRSNHFGGCREGEQLADAIRALVDRAEQGEVRSRRIEQTADERIRRHEKLLDRRLRRAEDRAMIDPLTGVRNRRFLDEELDSLVAAQNVRGGDLAVIMIDVDNFKPLNDTKGHSTGDEVLRFLGELLRAAIRPKDHAIRFGGDEFVLVLPDVSAEKAVAIMNRITKTFWQYAAQLRCAAPVSLSAGVATLRSDACASGQVLISRADAALYEAKHLGKNHVSLTPARATYVAEHRQTTHVGAL